MCVIGSISRGSPHFAPMKCDAIPCYRRIDRATLVAVHAEVPGGRGGLMTVHRSQQGANRLSMVSKEA